MRTIALSLAVLSASAYAETIPFSVTASASSTAVGNSVAFNGSLSPPGFDSDLGTLNSITFRLDATGKLLQDITTPLAPGYEDFVIHGSLAFLGTEKIVYSYELVQSCSPFPSTACTIRPNINYAPAGQGIFFSMWGTLTPDASEFRAWTDLGIRPFTTAAGTMNTFIGSVPIALPVSSIANVSGGWSGLLQAQQQTGWNLSGTYNYTPNNNFAAQAVHTPEPRSTALLLMGLMAAVAILRRLR